MYYIVINPSARSGRGRKSWKQLQTMLKEEQIPCRPVFLKKPGDAQEAARKLSSLPRPLNVVIAGGDGTLNEFLSGLDSFEGITLSVIPTGSGNDFVRGMGLPSRPRECVHMLKDPKMIKPIHVGIVSGSGRQRYFAVSSGLGYDAAVCYESVQSPLKTALNRLGLGKLIYTLNALRLLWTIRPLSLSVCLDGNETRHYASVYFAAAMNTRFEGGGFMFAPKADPCDESLDLIIVEGISRLKALLLLPTAFAGWHTRFGGIHLRRCSCVSIKSSEPACVHADGEHVGFESEVTFSLSRETLSILAG